MSPDKSEGVSETMPTFQVRLFVEAPRAEVEALVDEIGDLVCPEEHHHEPGTKCRRRWSVVWSELDPDEDAEWEGVLDD